MQGGQRTLIDGAIVDAHYKTTSACFFYINAKLTEMYSDSVPRYYSHILSIQGSMLPFMRQINLSGVKT